STAAAEQREVVHVVQHSPCVAAVRNAGDERGERSERVAHLERQRGRGVHGRALLRPVGGREERQGGAPCGRAQGGGHAHRQRLRAGRGGEGGPLRAAQGEPGGVGVDELGGRRGGGDQSQPIAHRARGDGLGGVHRDFHALQATIAGLAGVHLDVV